MGGKIGAAADYVKKYWSKAPANRYLSFKEAAAYCVGGIGINAASMVPTYLTLTYGMYVAAALGLSNDMIMWVVTLRALLPFCVLRSSTILSITQIPNTENSDLISYGCPFLVLY